MRERDLKAGARRSVQEKHGHACGIAINAESQHAPIGQAQTLIRHAGQHSWRAEIPLEKHHDRIRAGRADLREIQATGRASAPLRAWAACPGTCAGIPGAVPRPSPPPRDAGRGLCRAPRAAGKGASFRTCLERPAPDAAQRIQPAHCPTCRAETASALPAAHRRPAGRRPPRRNSGTRRHAEARPVLAQQRNDRIAIVFIEAARGDESAHRGCCMSHARTADTPSTSAIRR